MAAAARVHRRDQLDPRREGHVGVGAGDADAPGLERLAERIEHRALKFRQLIEEQHAKMREADLAGADAQAAADQRRHRGAVMRRAKRPACGLILPPPSSPATEATIDTSSASDGWSGGRMPGRHAASSDLPAPGGPLISRLCPPAAAISSARLATSWPLTWARSGPPSGGSASAGGGAGNQRGALEVREQRQQVGRGDDVELARPGGFAALRRRADQAFVERGGVERGEQHPRRGGDPPVETELAHRDIVRQVSASVAPIAASRQRAIGRS